VYKHHSNQQNSDADPQLLSGGGAPACRSLRYTIAGVLCLAAALAPGVSGAAGLRSGSFTVNICLKSGADCVAPSPAAPAASSSVCTSDTLSERTGAVVRVVCASGQFLSIAPRPGGRFIDSHGGTYTYSFGPSFGALYRASSGEFTQGTGTVASFSIFNVTEIEGPVEMLVSF